MIWVTWRQFRGTVLAGIVLPVLTAIVTVVAASAAGTARPFDLFFYCFGYSSRECAAQSTLTATALLTVALPVVLGVFVGTTVFTRDIERRTHVLGLSQSVGRLRWYLVRISVVFGPVIAAMGVLAGAQYWARNRYLAGSFVFIGSPDSRFDFPTFTSTGLVPVAYTVLGLAIGSTAALVLRHTIGAMIATLVVMVGALVVFGAQLREHYAKPDIEEVALEDTTAGGFSTYAEYQPGERIYPRWQVGTDYVDTDGDRVDVDSRTCDTTPDAYLEPLPDETAESFDQRTEEFYRQLQRDRAECLRASGVDHFEIRTHSDRLYWRFQWIESALCVLVALALGGASTGLVRRIRP